MPLLLLLSALLTALSGAVVGVRPADVQISRRAQAAQVEQAAIVTTARVAEHAHLLGAFGAIRRFAFGRGTVTFLATPRLYLDRPRA